MTDREKVILGIENCITTDSVTECRKTECPFIACRESCLEWLLRSALSLLKAQEPRVMTLEEIKDGESYWLSAGKEFVPRPVICVHREDDARKPYITFAWQFGTFSWELENYDKTWRCWTSRPTEEQRRATPWN